MSGRSGYGRSRIVGKIIHKPANMMIAGLAPRVGKSGASIRLYWQRVEECLCNGKCISEPITLLKRYLTAGKWGINARYGNLPGSGNIVIPILTGNVAIDAATLATTGGGIDGGGARAPYYILIFDKIVTSPFAPSANQATVPLEIFKGDSTSGGPTAVLAIPPTDYKYMTWSGGGTSLALSTEEFNVFTGAVTSSGWTIDISGNFGADTVGANKWHNINCETANGNIPWPNPGGWFNRKYSKFGPNITYIVDKNVSTHFPTVPNAKGAIIFHIGDLLVNSWQNNSTGGTSIQFGTSPYKELMLLVDATTSNPPGTTKNNISTTYRTPSGAPTGATINTEDDCFGETIAAPIGSFIIPSGSGTPLLEALPV